jgi:PEP-CTERM motif
MDRSKSVLKSLVATTLLTAGLLAASAALAQRAISNSRSGGGSDLVSLTPVPTLVGCNRSNTFSITNPSSPGLGGFSDACAVKEFGETIEAASSLVAGYVGKPNSLYTLSLAADAIPDRATATANGSSSGGLFSLSGVGTDAVTLEFQRGQVDDFVFVFSGVYFPNGVQGTSSPWSAYYLFDDVFVEPYSDISGVIRGGMNFELFEDVIVGSDRVRNYTTNLAVNQVSIYTLDRTLRPNAVPEAGSLALAGLGLAVLVAVRRRRRGART